MSEPLSVGISPCPNDTFIFCEMAKKQDYSFCFHDVESLNQMAFDERFDVTKLSFHAWLNLKDKYELLPVGAALGRGCGPLFVEKKGDAGVCSRIVALPGKYTTAHLLFRLWFSREFSPLFMPFDQIMQAVSCGEANAGVIIHEGRFTYQRYGLKPVLDLGEWWEKKTGLPVPLGCIAVKKRLGIDQIAAVKCDLKKSIDVALNDPVSTRLFVQYHAQELQNDVIDKHIALYVNTFTQELGHEGRDAIAKLEAMAKKRGGV